MHERTLKALEYHKVLEHLSDRCVSPAGRAAALALRPLPTAHEATEAALLHDECHTWAVSARTGDTSAFALAAFPDISTVTRYVQAPAAVLDTDALWAVHEVLRLARSAQDSLNQPRAATDWPRLAALAGAQPLPTALSAALRRCLADDATLKDESSPELLLARTELRRLHQSCLRKVREFAVQYNILHYLQDEFMTLASDRYVLPLKANFKGRVQGIIHDWSQTGETCYFEPMFLVEVNNRLQELRREEREAERAVLAYLTELVRDAVPALEGIFALLVRLDVLLAALRLATAMGGANAPTLATDSGVHVLLARHPLLALTGQAQPVDILLPHGTCGLIISGGNAGGKTVCLKTLGLIALMAMTGLPVPVGKGSIMPPWTRIHAFIGDEQSLDDHVSTFTAQIRHLAHAWNGLDDSASTLILLDEFGVGTDPAQGAALAQGVIDCLLERAIFVLAATHFPALKAYALTHAKARAASVLFDPHTKKPLFRLAFDQVGASQALDVAREHGLPDTMLRRAEHYLLLDTAHGPDGEHASGLMARLNALAVEREHALTALRHEHERLREKRRQIQERFERERQNLYDEVRKKAQEIMAAWRAGKRTHKETLKDMSALRATTARAGESFAAPAQAPQALQALQAVDTLRPGQSVRHRVLGRAGIVTEVDTRRQRVRVDLHGVTLWAEMKDIESSHSHSAPAATIRVNAAENVPLRLDVRGNRADIAEQLVMQFLDAALRNGRESAEILHGRGTGVLRAAVQEAVRTIPGARAELANEDHGGDGVTIVYF